MPAAKIDPTDVNRIRQLLDDVSRAKSGLAYQSAMKVATGAIEGLPPEAQLPILQKAMGKGIRRFRSAASALARCKQNAHIDEWITAAFEDQDAERRIWIVQVIGLERLTRFAPQVNRMIEEDPDCREFAIIAAGNMRLRSNCDMLVSYANSLGAQDIPMNLLQSLSKFKSEKTKPFLQRAFECGSEEHYRVFAAWGLGRHGDRNAIEYLVKMLDVENDGPSLAARRAAQALSDLFDWKLEWAPDAPAQAKERWRTRT
jgi:hypothetical protein